MWFLLATSLLALSFQRLLALALLLATCCLAFYDGVIAPPAVAALAALGVLALLRRRLAARRAWAVGLELLLVAGAVGLFLHLLPGFANPRVLDKAVVGPQSLPFTMYFNFDKALVPFLLLACLPSLFRDEARAPGRPWHWLLLVAAVPALLLLAVGVGLLRPELHAPPGSGSSSWPTCSSFPLPRKRCSAATCSNAWANGWAPGPPWRWPRRCSAWRTSPAARC